MGKNTDIYKLISKRRSVRAFEQRQVPINLVKKAINSARLAPSAANLQFLEYLVINDKKLCDRIFPNTRWAGYLYPKHQPLEGMRPTVYIVILANKEKSKKGDLRDVGAAAENIILTLLDQGVGSCWIASLKRALLRKILKIPPKYRIDSLIAVGWPKESPRLEQDSKKLKYWLDKRGRLHVPKRPMEDVYHHNEINFLK